MKVVVILPTYNERDNARPLVAALQDQFKGMSHEMHILVVDDNSPDGTADVVRELRSRHANLHLIEGKRAGLGAAYIRGMRYALEALSAQVIFEMDGHCEHGIPRQPLEPVVYCVGITISQIKALNEQNVRVLLLTESSLPQQTAPIPAGYTSSQLMLTAHYRLALVHDRYGGYAHHAVD